MPSPPSLTSPFALARPFAWLLTLVLASTCVTAQAATPAVLPDTLEQRLAPCLSCHMPKQRNDAYFPRIAGKPAGYLYNQLINFRDGRRQSPTMAYMVSQLPDAYLHEIADYFSQQHPTMPVAIAGSGVNADAATLVRGQALVLHGDPARQIPACVACHGSALAGAAPAIPGLLGLPSDYINAQFGAWRGKTRRAAAPDCMAEIASRLTTADISAVSSWLSRQPPAVPTQATEQLKLPLPLRCGSVDAP